MVLLVGVSKAQLLFEALMGIRLLPLPSKKVMGDDDVFNSRYGNSKVMVSFSIPSTV